MQPQNNPVQFRIRINHYIRVPQVRVLNAEGELLGVFPTVEALKMAKDQGLDLIEINPKSSPPVCKIEDFGKFKYDEKKRQSTARKNQKFSEVKEVAFRPATDQGDLDHKLQNAKSFLEDGDKVKFVVKFRGREISHPQVGRDKLTWLLEQLAPLIGHQTPILSEGKVMIVTVGPKSSNNQ